MLVPTQMGTNMAAGNQQKHLSLKFVCYLAIRLRARVFYEQIVNEAQPSGLSLVENEGE